MDGPSPQLLSAWWKVDRAQEHINQFNWGMDQYLSRRPLRFVRRYDFKDNQMVYSIRQDEPVPSTLLLVFGDAIHNLRDALDHAIYGMVDGTGAVMKDAMFPTVRNEALLDQRIKKCQVEFAGEQVVEQVKAWRPFYEGNESPNFWGLNQLDISDKHKVLLTAATGVALNGDEFAAIVGPSGRKMGEVHIGLGGSLSVPMGDNSRPRRRENMKRFGTQEVDAPVSSSFRIRMGENEPFSNSTASMSEVLGILAETVAKSLRRFETILREAA